MTNWPIIRCYCRRARLGWHTWEPGESCPPAAPVPLQQADPYLHAVMAEADNWGDKW